MEKPVQSSELILRSTWRSLNPICEDSPLAFCDYRSVEAKDLIPSDRIIPERAGEVYYLFHNKGQRWVSAGQHGLCGFNTMLTWVKQPTTALAK